MSDNTTNVISEEELKEKLTLMYNSLKEGVKYRDLSDKYDITERQLAALKHMSQSEFNNFLDKISNIKESIKAREINKKIALKYDCDSSLVAYIGRHQYNEYTGRVGTKNKKIEFYKKTEQIWKRYREGINLKDLSCIYNIDVEELEQLLNNFEKLLNRERPQVTRDKETKKRALREKYGFDDDTIEYILNQKYKPNIISVEEAKQRLVSLYNDINLEEVPIEQLKEGYGATPAIMSELRRISKQNFDKFLESISYIKQSIQEGKTAYKISNELGCGGRLVSFVAKQVCGDYSKNKDLKSTGEQSNRKPTNFGEIVLDDI